MSKLWDYGGAYRQIEMGGIIELPNDSKLKVCDLTKELPSFMLQADTIFCDPPCSPGNLRSFHTKADRQLEYSFNEFENALFERITQIKPKYLFLEVFKSNKEPFLARCKQMYKSVVAYENTYYHASKYKCWVLHCTNEPTNRHYPELNGIDEQRVIEWLCANHKFECIGDLCMGQGMVGKNAFLNGRKFVGTELNKKRLAVLVDFIKKNYHAKI